MSASQKIVLSSDITAGTGDAADEIELLKTAFIDTGYYDQLKNIQNSKCIVLGPTGVGKTAIINQLSATLENVVQIHPDDLSISYIHRSTIIQDMEQCGVNLAPVFRFMWQHVFLVELIRLKFELNSENSIIRWIEKLKAKYLSGTKEYQAVQYMETWDHNIWESVNKRVQELTKSLEEAVKLDGSLDTKAFASVSGGMSEKETSEKKERYESIVNTFISQQLVKEQKDIMDICANDFFANKQRPYYILIDDLDKDWAPNDLRGLLLKALLIAVKQIKKIPNVKIIIGLREDIKHQLFHETPTSGFQEDKYESLELKLSWSGAQLKNLANTRINVSFKSKYTNASVNLEQIFSSFQIDKMTPIQYIISRTRSRPRELILFINSCIERARNERQNHISRDVLLSAEKQYSAKRIQAVHDEWCLVYPCIKVYFNILRRKPATYSVGRLLKIDSTEFVNELAMHQDSRSDPIGKKVLQNGEGGSPQISDRKLFRELVKIFYQCGIVGMKISPEMPAIWSHKDDPVIEDTAFDNKSQIYIHPAFYSVLGINKHQGQQPKITKL